MQRWLLVGLALAGCAHRPGGNDPLVQTPTGPLHLPVAYATRSSRNPPDVVDRPAGATLTVPTGFAIEPWAEGIGEARWAAVAPSGELFVSDHGTGEVRVYRDADHDGHADAPGVFAHGLSQPFGLAFHPAGWLYVGDTDAVVRFAYRPGQRVAEGAPGHVLDLPGRGYHQHWTRDVAVSPDGAHVYATVGSETNDDVEPDPRRAAISVFDPDGSHARIFASGLRNAVGIAFEPVSHALFAVVNERDELGDDLVPDYFTAVRDGAFYGWPYSYFGRIEDPHHRGERPDLVARAVVPDLALGAHVAALGLVFYTGSQFPAAYRGDAFVALHGSWNRSHRVGYTVVRVHFRDGRPTGQVSDFVTGWLTPRDKVWGRPVGLAIAQDGALMVVDDGGHTIWRVSYRAAGR